MITSPPATHCPSKRMSPSTCNRVPVVGCWKKKSTPCPPSTPITTTTSNTEAAQVPKAPQPRPSLARSAPCRETPGRRRARKFKPNSRQTQPGTKGRAEGQGMTAFPAKSGHPGPGSEGQDSQAVPAPANLGSRTQSSGSTCTSTSSPQTLHRRITLSRGEMRSERG